MRIDTQPKKGTQCDLCGRFAAAYVTEKRASDDLVTRICEACLKFGASLFREQRRWEAGAK